MKPAHARLMNFVGPLLALTFALPNVAAGHGGTMSGRSGFSTDRLLSGPTDAWSMGGREPTHQRRSISAGPEIVYQTLTSDVAKPFFSSPAVSVSNHVYAGREDGFLYSFDADLNLRWKLDLGAKVSSSSPAVVEDDVLGEVIYIGTQAVGGTKDNFFCIQDQGASGVVLWSHKLPGKVTSSPTYVRVPGVVYVGCNDGFLYSFQHSATKTLRWSFDSGASLGSGTPAALIISFHLVAIYFGNEAGRMFCVIDNWLFGTPVQYWKYNPGVGMKSSYAPAIDPVRGAVYFPVNTTATGSGALYAFTLGGLLKWKTPAPSPDGKADYLYSPAIGADGHVYLGSENYHVYEIEPAGGTIVHSFLTMGWVHSTPAIDGNGNVFIGCDDLSTGALLGTVYGLTPGLTQIWSQSVIGRVHAGVSLSMGTLYLGADEAEVTGRLYAIR